MSETLESERTLIGEANLLNGEMIFRFFQCPGGPRFKQVLIETEWSSSLDETEFYESLLFGELGSSIRESADRDFIEIINPFL